MAQGPPAYPKLFCTVNQISEKFVERDNLAKTVFLHILNSWEKGGDMTYSNLPGTHPLARDSKCLEINQQIHFKLTLGNTSVEVIRS